MYELTTLQEYPIVVLELVDEINSAVIRALFVDSTTHLQKIGGAAGFIMDFTRLTDLDTDKFVQSLQVFYRLSPTFKADAPIYYAFIGQATFIERIVAMLNQLGVNIPVFNNTEAAISFLTLKVESAYIKQGLKAIGTEDLSTLHFGVKRGGGNTSISPKRHSNFPASGVLKVQEVETKKSMLVIPQNEVTIGRRTADQDKPTIDLSLWGAYHRGVSRLHAKIVREGASLQLIDLGSSNGTYLNGTRLSAHKATTLCDGDEITFGSLLTAIYFQDTLLNISTPE